MSKCAFPILGLKFAIPIKVPPIPKLLTLPTIGMRNYKLRGIPSLLCKFAIPLSVPKIPPRLPTLPTIGMRNYKLRGIPNLLVKFGVPFQVPPTPKVPSIPMPPCPLDKVKK